MFKVNNKDTRATPLILKNFTPCCSVSIVNFENVISDWENTSKD